MAKIFESNEEIIAIANEMFEETGLSNYGLTLKVMSVPKSKEILKISKASPATEFLTNKNGIIQLFVYESAFDRLDEDSQKILLEMIFSNVWYDADKDKINIDNVPYSGLIRMRQKYGNVILDKIELSLLTMKQIEDEEKEAKEQAKELKKAKNS